jgi:hypothetical protein
MKRVSDLQYILAELEQIMVKKHKDYGPMNIAGAPGGAMNGLRVRMYDKLARLNNLADTGDTPNYESIEDTLIDLANYAIIGLLVQRGQWEGLPNLNGSETKKSGSTERLTDTISEQLGRKRNPGLYPKLQTR